MSNLQPPPVNQGRVIFLALLVCLGFLVVLAGYYRVQIIEGGRYERLGEKYRIKKTRYKAPRGLIYDRDKRLITQNMPTYNLVLLRDEMKSSWKWFRPRVAQFLGISEERLERRYTKRSRLFSEPVLLRENIGYRESLRIMRHQRRFPGLAVETAGNRHYTHGSLFAHVLGFVGEASREQLRKNPDLHLGDIVGKSGIERKYNEVLTGVDGERTIEIDSRGVYRSNRLTTPATPGGDLYLTLDYDLQNLAVEALDGRSGSIVMMDVRTGDILVYLSSPAYDLNLFTTGISAEDWSHLRNAPTRPFLNRPMRGTYAPGSVFKLITALAALQDGVITPESRYFCSGKVNFYNREFRCHREEGHGLVDLRGAIQTSCNVYFFSLGLDLDIHTLARTAKQFGFGRTTGLDLVGEKPGLVPTPEWKKKTQNQIWYPGDTLNLTIGQGDLLSTPIQVVQLMAALANEGQLVTPRFLLSRTDQGKETRFPVKTQPIQGIPRHHYQLLKEAMWRVVNDPSGTGNSAKVDGFDVCGKTGTAQLITFTREEDHEIDAYKNAWFAGFAPRDEARVAIMVLVERAGAGGANAAPIARILLEAYMRSLKGVDPT